MRNAIIEYQLINRCIAHLRLKSKPLYVYKSHQCKWMNRKCRRRWKRRVYKALEEVQSFIPKQDTIIMAGYFSSQMGKQEYLIMVAGIHILHDETNKNASRLRSITPMTDMVAVRTNKI